MTPIETYRARDLRIAIGLPIKQDTGEYEWPGSIDGELIAFYATPRHAELALNNILDALSMHAPVVDVKFVSVGWA